MSRVFYATQIGDWTEIGDAEFAGLTHAGKVEFLTNEWVYTVPSGEAIYSSDLNKLADFGKK